MTKLRTVLLVGAAGLLFMTGIQAADHDSERRDHIRFGQRLDGVTVYAKMDGFDRDDRRLHGRIRQRITSRRSPAGKYRVWAQALGFEATKAMVDLGATRKHDLVLQPITDPERRFRQLPSEMMAQALPEATPATLA